MDILSKIKKLLALSKSPNANEAAAALLRAQELMTEYGIDHKAIAESEIVERAVSRRGGERPPQYEVSLIYAIKKAFGCDVFHRSTWDGPQWIFVGIEYRAEIAEYMATVLLRKLASARSSYIKTLYRCKRDTKVRRGDEFCIGWVSNAVARIRAFVGTPEEDALLAHYMQRYSLGSLDSLKRKKIDKYEAKDFFRGHLAANDVELQHGVKGKQGQTLIGEGAC